MIHSNPGGAVVSSLPSESKVRRTGFADWAVAWTAKHPVLAIVFVSLLAVAINCYPVIFCGKSHVSPAGVHVLVYDWWPPLPGMAPGVKVIPAHGSDVAATMWWGIPAGFIASRSLLEHGELPLWNRYSHAGDTLIGQAVSMLGDPLQLIVILGHGSAVAWDIKFLTAKFLFCVGFGLLILRLLANRPMSIIFTVLAAYCGAFYFIKNHPVFFVFCYAPWILLSALAFLELPSKRYVRCGLVWLLTNFACFNAGHVEVSVVLIGGLNLAALAYALSVSRSAGARATVLARMAVGTLLFLGLTAPVWMSFLGALNGAYSAHQSIKVDQLPLKSLPRIFDDTFDPTLTRPFMPRSPGTSLLVLVGCILSVNRWRQLRQAPFFWINTVAIVLWGGCVWMGSSLCAGGHSTIKSRGAYLH